MQHGEEFLKEGGASAASGAGVDLFEMLSGKSGRNRGPRKSDNTEQRLEVSLKDFYVGTTKCAFSP
jgi:DnaJ-class molecular chaperone